MFYTDKPIKNNNGDLLNRAGFAKMLAKSLLNLNVVDTFTVGLFGKWGSGKTSIVNMMIEELEAQQKGKEEKDKLFVVHFEPWNFADTNQLLSQFFIRLANEFRSKKDKKLEKIGMALQKYSEAFYAAEGIPYVGSAIAQAGKFGMNALGHRMRKGSDEADILKQKEYVINLLEQQSTRILVVIDDIDRLSNEQIRYVFQLITSVAKFPNTTYLLVFDKEIVTKALEKVQEGLGEEYLEKIIQMPIQIPELQNYEIKKVLINRMNEILINYGEVTFSDAHWHSLFDKCIAPFAKNLRDINRLCNSVEFKLSAIASEVNFTDMVAISALEISMPEIYEWVKANKTILTGENDLSNVGAREKSQKEWLVFYTEALKELLSNHGQQVQNLVEMGMDFLTNLFPYFGKRVGKTYVTVDFDLLRRENRIAHGNKFDRYFNLNLDYIGVKKFDINWAINKYNSEELSKFLLELEEKEYSYEFLEEIQAMIPKLSEERAEVIVTALCKTGAYLENVTQNNFFSLRSDTYVSLLIIKILEKILTHNRKSFIANMIEGADLDSLQTIAALIRQIEFDHGRLGEDGPSYKDKIITLDELIELERVLFDKLKAEFETNSLFDFHSWNFIYGLLKVFEPEYTKTYLSELFKEDRNVLLFLDVCVGKWTGSSVSYEVKQFSDEPVSKDRVMSAIQAQRKNGELFKLPQEIQNKCCAFYLKEMNKVNYEGHISPVDIDALLIEWKNAL